MTYLADWEIISLCKGDRPMIKPFLSSLVSEVFYKPLPKATSDVTELKTLSFGLSSHGYDARLASKEFRLFDPPAGAVVDPKNPNPEHYVYQELNRDDTGKYFILPPFGSALGVSIEYFDIPRNITVICKAKSTYARSFVICHVTPFESGWKGYPTLEFTNPTRAYQKIYANEGICQLVFERGEDCQVSYADRKGKYQDQPQQVVLGRV